MATFRRGVTPRATYFFTVNTYQRQRVPPDQSFFRALKHSIRRVREIHPFKIEAFVLLLDHLPLDLDTT